MYAGYVNALYAIDASGISWHLTRMDEPNSERVITPMPASLVQAIDDFRFASRLPSRAETIRRLIQFGLEAQKANAENER